MTAWVRVRLDGVGEWSQAERCELPEGAVILTGVAALNLDGTARPPISDDSHLTPAPAVAAPAPVAAAAPPAVRIPAQGTPPPIESSGEQPAAGGDTTTPKE